MGTLARIHEAPTGLVASVAANIRAECALRGIQQQELAALIGIARSSVGERWWGRRQWQLEDLEKVAAVFGIDPGRLCAIRDSNPEPADYGPDRGTPYATVLAFRRRPVRPLPFAAHD